MERKFDIHVKLLLPLVKIIKIQFGAMCYQWIVAISCWVGHGCMTKITLMVCATTHRFMHSGKQVTLHPVKLKLSKKKSRANATKEALHGHYLYRGNMKKNRV